MRLRQARNFATNLLMLFGFAISGIACGEMGELESGICGNFVIDPGEDCDGHSLDTGTACAAPRTLHECRQICSDSIRCPVGWGCGLDGICRQPSGHYAPFANPVPFATPNVMQSGDFDNDGLADILLLGHENTIGLRPARIGYMQPGGKTMDMHALHLDMASPYVGEVGDDDDFIDVAFATRSGVSLFLGANNRVSEFGVLPHFSALDEAPIHILPLDVLPDVPGDEVIALIEQPNGKTAITAYDANISLLELPYELKALSKNVHHGRFNENGSCAQLVWAPQDADAITLFSPCQTDGSFGWNMTTPPTTISLPKGTKATGRMLVVDLDLNGHLDLYLETNGQPHAAWGFGNGSFHSEKVGGLPNAAGPRPMPNEANGEFPLVADDLNADSVIDYVLPHAVLISGEGKYKVVYENFGAAWSASALADFNGNQQLDAVICSSESIDCTFLNNSGTGLFNPATIATEGPIQLLTTGDFDGDFIQDVALLEAFDSHIEGENNRLAIAFGEPFGPPTEVVRVGRLENATQLTTAIFREPWEPPDLTDKVADLIATDQHHKTEDGATKLIFHSSLFRGSASRVLHTTRPLKSGEILDLPISLTFSKTADEDDQEIAALGLNQMTGDLRLWTIEEVAAGDARPGPIFEPGFHSSSGAGEVSFRYGSLMEATDFNGDGSNELVVIAPFGTSSEGAALVIADHDSTTDLFVPRKPQPISAAITVDSRFKLEDLDADGLVDAVLTTGTHEEPGDLIVLWGDATKGFDVTAPQHVRPQDGAGGFACVPTLQGCRLFVTSPSGTYAANIATTRRIELVRVDELPAAASIATGDFDGDGIVDIAVHTDNTLTVFRSVPVNP